MDVVDFDVFPFIETADRTPSFPLSNLILVSITAVTFNYGYNKSVELFPDKKKAARIAPLLHAIYATCSSIYVLYNYSPTLQSPLNLCAAALGPSHYVFLISLGYFIWDLFICIKENWGIDWKMHALFCVLMYGIAVCKHTFHRWGLMVLFYEFSTIFLHCYIFLYYYGYKTLASRLKIIFGIAFFFCRIIVGSVVSKEVIEAYFQIKPFNISCVGYKIM
eukprot:2667_1